MLTFTAECPTPCWQSHKMTFSKKQNWLAIALGRVLPAYIILVGFAGGLSSWECITKINLLVNQTKQSKTKILQVATQIPTFFSLFILCGRVQYTCTLYNRVSQYVTNFRFFNVFITSQAHLRPKVLKKAICCRSLQNLQAEIDCCANFLAVTKLYKIESQLFAVRFLCQSYSKANFTISL